MATRYIVVPINVYPEPRQVDTAEEAVEIATQRIQKNQGRYGGVRERYEYAICKIEAVVKPVPPPEVEVVVLNEEPDGEA